MAAGSGGRFGVGAAVDRKGQSADRRRLVAIAAGEAGQGLAVGHAGVAGGNDQRRLPAGQDGRILWSQGPSGGQGPGVDRAGGGAVVAADGKTGAVRGGHGRPRLVKADQRAGLAVAGDTAGGVGIDDQGAVGTHQTAGGLSAGPDGAQGEGALDGADLRPRQAPHRAVADHIGRAVAVADGPGVAAHQAADDGDAGRREGTVGAGIFDHRRAAGGPGEDAGPVGIGGGGCGGHCGADQRQVLDGSGNCAEQAAARQIADAVAQAVQAAGEGVARRADGGETSGVGHVDVAHQGVAAAGGHRLEAGGRADQAGQDTAVVIAQFQHGIIAAQGHSGAAGDHIAAALATLVVLQGQAGGVAAGGDGGIDVDVAPGRQGQGLAGGPDDGRVHRDVAVAVAAGIVGGQGDVGGLQGVFVGSGAGGVDGQVAGVDPPQAGLPVGGAGIDDGRAFDQSARGVDDAAVAAFGAAAGGQTAGQGGGSRSQDGDIAAIADGAGRGVDDRTVGQRHRALAGRDGVGLDHAVGIEGLALHAVDGGGGALGDLGRRRRVGDLVAPQAIAGGVDGETAGGAQLDAAPRGGDGAGIGDLRRRQHHRAAGIRLQRAEVGDVALSRDRGETVAAGQIIAVGQGRTGQQQAGGADGAAGADGDAVGIKQEQAAVGLQLAVDLRGLAAGHPVEQGGGGRGLDEFHRFAGADGKIRPVDHRLRRGLGDRQDVAGLAEADAADRLWRRLRIGQARRCPQNCRGGGGKLEQMAKSHGGSRLAGIWVAGYTLFRCV